MIHDKSSLDLAGDSSNLQEVGLWRAIRCRCFALEKAHRWLVSGLIAGELNRDK
jgi:hypothetical protein